MYCHQCGRKLDASVCFCPDCGAKQNISTEEKNDSATVDRTTPVSSKDRDNTDISKKEAGYQQARFVISVATMVFTFLILFQSCAVGLGNSLEGNLEIGGSAGLLLCICWWIAGVLNISKRKEAKSARSAAVAYIVAGVIGLLLAGSFADLKIYSVASFIFAGICYLASKEITHKKQS